MLRNRFMSRDILTIYGFSPIIWIVGDQCIISDKTCWADNGYYVVKKHRMTWPWFGHISKSVDKAINHQWYLCICVWLYLVMNRRMILIYFWSFFFSCWFVVCALSDDVWLNKPLWTWTWTWRDAIIVNHQKLLFHSTLLNTLRPRQMDAISQMTFSNAFSWMKMFELRWKFHWNLFARVQLTIFQHWCR